MFGDLSFNVACIYPVVNAVLLQYMWNNVLVKHVIIFAPIDTMLDAFLMSMGMSMLRHYCQV